MRLHALASLVLLGACAEATTDDVTDTDVVADTDSDTVDTTDTTDTDAGDTDVEETSGPLGCLSHHGIQGASSRWTYRWHDSTRTGNRQATVFEYDANANTATVRTVDNWTVPGASHTGTVYEYFRCDLDGIYLLRRLSDATTTIAGTPSVSHSDRTYTTAPLLRPNSPVGGNTWMSHGIGDAVGADGVPQHFDTTTQYGVLEEDINVSGGWVAIKIGSPDGTFYYWQEDVGQIYDPSIAWLDSYTP